MIAFSVSTKIRLAMFFFKKESFDWFTNSVRVKVSICMICYLIFEKHICIAFKQIVTS